MVQPSQLDGGRQHHRLQSGGGDEQGLAFATLLSPSLTLQLEVLCVQRFFRTAVVTRGHLTSCSLSVVSKLPFEGLALCTFSDLRFYRHIAVAQPCRTSYPVVLNI